MDIQSLDSSVVVDIKYSSPDNFMGENMYGSLKTAWLVPEMADRVVRAHRRLQTLEPGHALVIFDAARPISIQRKMYAEVAGTDKAAYVADPEHEGGGYHNYGLAVDLSIVDSAKNFLDMGSGFDHFGYESHVGDEEKLLAEGKISDKAYHNRLMLYSLMGEQGMFPHQNEWWHYQHVRDDARKRRYRLLDF